METHLHGCGLLYVHTSGLVLFFEVVDYVLVEMAVSSLGTRSASIMVC